LKKYFSHRDKYLIFIDRVPQQRDEGEEEETKSSSPSEAEEENEILFA